MAADEQTEMLIRTGWERSEWHARELGRCDAPDCGRAAPWSNPRVAGDRCTRHAVAASIERGWS